MCGIFGVVAGRGEAMNAEHLIALAVDAESRGPQAWGCTWIDSKGRLHVHKRVGAVSKTGMDDLKKIAATAVAVVGHTRWATHGSLTHINNHPHPCDSGWMVHNGIVANYEEIKASLSTTPLGDCDSEALALLIAEQEGSLCERVRDGVKQVSTYSPLALAGLWTRPNRLMLAKRGNPMEASRDKSGAFYFCSLGGKLPGTKVVVKENCVTVWDLASGDKREAKLKKIKSYPGGARVLGSNYFGDDDFGDGIGSGWTHGGSACSPMERRWSGKGRMGFREEADVAAERQDEWSDVERAEWAAVMAENGWFWDGTKGKFVYKAKDGRTVEDGQMTFEESLMADAVALRTANAQLEAKLRDEPTEADKDRMIAEGGGGTAIQTIPLAVPPHAAEVLVPKTSPIGGIIGKATDLLKRGSGRHNDKRSEVYSAPAIHTSKR